MTKTDVVLTFYATPGKQQADPSLVEPAQMFDHPPTVMPVSMSADDDRSKGFASVGQRLRNPSTGRLLPALLAPLLRSGVQVGRVAAVGFSAGKALTQELLQHPKDRAAIDTVVDLDGLQWLRNPQTGAPFQQLYEPWVMYGSLALDGSHMLVCAHTDITPINAATVCSTTEANRILFEDTLPYIYQSMGDEWKYANPVDQAEFKAGPPPPTVTTPAQAGMPAGRYEAFPDIGFSSVGNCHRIHMPGNDAAAHIFTCYWIQRGIWRTLMRERWSDANQTICTAASGLGGPQTCKQATTYVSNNDLLDDIALLPSPRPSAAEVAVAFVAGALGGYVLVQTAEQFLGRQKR